MENLVDAVTTLSYVKGRMPLSGSDVACPARDYPARWRARMNNWAIMGLDLGGKKATDAVWYDLVDKPKLSYFKI